jgi:hypothetical protein
VKSSAKYVLAAEGTIRDALELDNEDSRTADAELLALAQVYATLALVAAVAGQ